MPNIDFTDITLPQPKPSGGKTDWIARELPATYDGISIPLLPDNVVCHWCHSRAKDDALGNCSACGGPREAEVASGSGMVNWRI